MKITLKMIVGMMLSAVTILGSAFIVYAIGNTLENNEGEGMMVVNPQWAIFCTIVAGLVGLIVLIKRNVQIDKQFKV